MKNKLVIWGASGHAKVVADIIKLADEYELVGFLDDINLKGAHTKLLNLPVFHGRKYLEILKKQGVKHLLFGFGDCMAKLRLSEWIIEEGFSLAKAIHPRSVIADGVVIAAGTVVMAGAVINAGAKIGRNVIINTSAVIEHDCVVQDCAHICPGALLGGDVKVGSAAWVGIGAVVKEKIWIGARSIVGAGSVVIDDISERSIVYGVPAKKKKEAI